MRGVQRGKEPPPPTPQDGACRRTIVPMSRGCVGKRRKSSTFSNSDNAALNI